MADIKRFPVERQHMNYILKKKKNALPAIGRMSGEESQKDGDGSVCRPMEESK